MMRRGWQTLQRGVGDAHYRWPVERRALGVQRRLVHHRVTGSAMPAGVSSTAVSEAGDVSDEDLIRSERVPIRAAGWWSGDPLPGSGLHQLAQHS